MRLSITRAGWVLACMPLGSAAFALAAGAGTRVYVNTIQGGRAKSRPGAISVGQGQCTPYFRNSQ